MIADDSTPVSPRSFLAAATALIGADALLAVEVSALITPHHDERTLPAAGEWDAAFVRYVGYWSHYDHARRASTWPLPHAGSPEELVGAAHVLGLMRLVPEPADIFTTWSAARRQFVRTGIIVSVTDRRLGTDGTPYYACVTLEGNVNARADARGPLVRCVRRCVSADWGDRFIRWTEPATRFTVSSSAPAPALLRRAA